MSRPKVAIDARLIGGTSTGDSSYWFGLVHGLSKLSLDLDFLFISNAPQPALIPDAPNFSWIELSAKSSRWWSYVKFPLLARKLGADALHTQYTLSPLAGSRGITTIHDVSFLIGPEWFKLHDRLILSKMVHKTAKIARRIIAVSNTCKGEIENHVPDARGKVLPIYNGLPPWVRRVNDPTTTLKDLDVSQPYVLTVGTQWPRKNMDLAVQAARLAGTQIVVTGKSGWGNQAEGSHVKPVGYVTNEQLCALYSGASLYLAPSRHEGFGIPVIEAFECGCPVLSSSGGALPEVVGDAGVVEPTWDPKHWSETIQSMLADSSKLEELRQRGFERVKQFDWVESARQTANVYQEVILDRP